jgi:hypothetical protein
MDSSDLVSALVAAILVLIAATATGLKEYIQVRFKKWVKNAEREKQTYANGIKKHAHFLQYVEHINQYSFVDRVLVFSGTNCGGIPDPKKPYTLTCFRSWFANEDKKIQELYDFPLKKLDHHYMRLILEILDKPVVNVTATELPENSQLRNFYQLEGVVAARMYQLYISDIELIYISIASYKKPFEEIETHKIDMYVERIRSIFNEDSK